uniref:uncharacterized protein zgc:113229 n=1 Tax=Scatophagus argus TaxID=75038 RepID=UPI001ED81F6A|nr:uncharacterized protein zgc:113229 [Scatophagus argus]
MSQSRNPTDTQGLLQSMLQRLKIHSGREGQEYVHTPVPITTSSTWGQDGVRGASCLDSPVNGLGFDTNGIPSKEFGIPAVDNNFGLKGEKIQQPGLSYEVNRGFTSFPTQKGNAVGDTGENRLLGQATLPGITPPSTKDAEITSFERTKGEMVAFGSSAITRHTPSNKDAVTSMGQNKDEDQEFKPKVYMWSVKPPDFDMGNQKDKMLNMRNGVFGALAQSKDMHADQKTTNSISRRKQQSPEHKTRRWTQKIKERWKDRPGSFGKKRKEEEQKEEQKNEQGTEISPENQLLTRETPVSASDKKEERALPSLDSRGPSKNPLTHTEVKTNEGYTRSAGDFEIGLGSFSLLEEIVTGQEWAKFLKPKQSAASTIQKPSGELQIPLNSCGSSQSCQILNHEGGVNSKWSFRGAEASQVSGFSMAQILPGGFVPARMDVSEEKQQQHVHREADLSEPMEHGHAQSNVQSGDSGLGQPLRPPSFPQPADILNNPVLRHRAQLNRKRHHHSTENRDERLQTEKISDTKEADREGSIPSPSLTSSHVMEEAGESQQDSVMPLYMPNSPPSLLTPSAFNPFAHAPKGVLKHSISQDSESSVEIVTKRRRVEENRRVRFSEALVTIAPPELNPDATDSEEDSGAEQDAVIQQEPEVEQALVEEMAPARRPALPAWILALKRRNTGRKRR